MVADVTRPAQIDIMKRHDIIYLFSPTWLGLAGLKKDLNILGNDLVTHIWADDEYVVRCFNDEQCIQDDRNPDGMYVNLVPQPFDRFISPFFQTALETLCVHLLGQQAERWKVEQPFGSVVVQPLRIRMESCVRLSLQFRVT